MTVALDATPLTCPTGGVPRYTASLARALAALEPSLQVALISDQAIPPWPDASSNIAWDGPQRSWERRWWSLGIHASLRRVRAQVFHGTDFHVPYLPLLPSVMTVHDLSPWRDPAWHVGAARVRRRTPWLLRLGMATMMITPSEAIRRELLACFGLAPTRVVAVPHAAGEAFRPVEALPSATRYLLCVGTLEPRKNLPFLVEVWREVVRTRPVELWLVGHTREDAPPLPDLPGLRRLGPVPDAALPALYSQSVAAVYPSLYEGFGLPVLEAMQCGAPVVTTTDPAVSEVAGEDAIRLAPDDHRGWVAALTALLAHPEQRATWRVRGQGRAAAFTWERTARETLAVYAEAEGRFGR